MLDQPRRPVWAEMDIEQRHTAVKDLLDRQGTMTSIGLALRTSRSAIASHVYRYRNEMGLPAADPRAGVKARQLRHLPKAPTPKKPKKAKRKLGASFFRPAPAEADRLDPDMGPLRAENWQALPETEPVSLLDLGLHDCRWPIGEKPTLYCGQVAREGGPYCLRHHALAYQPKAAA